MQEKTVVAVDAMGGDNAPGEIVRGSAGCDRQARRHQGYTGGKIRSDSEGIGRGFLPEGSAGDCGSL